MRWDGARFETHRRGPSFDSLSDNMIRALAQDASGALWIGTYGGLNRFDPETASFTRYRHHPLDPAGLAHDTILDLHVDDADGLWIATEGGGLDRLDLRTGRFVHHRHDLIVPRSR